MIGYNDDSKAYKIYDPTGKRILIRKDVIFNENRDRLHKMTETKVVDNKDDQETSEEEIDQPERGRQPSESDKLKKKYRNLRLLIPRSPYNTRKGSRSNEDESEEIVIMAEVCVAQLEPTNLEDAMKSRDSRKWLAAINEEIDSLEKNETWVLVPQTKDKHVITNRWVFKKKYKVNGEVDKYKA
ncbi:gag-pol polyprotein [Lasius niger]|uniref:Gag-pol polyprotein n=1 Tax=Lasius niger TaxID=67767 RepID=A0A0J7K7B5_LASNI|nr:gag-pol polyprotein [Lasius niger]